MEQVGIIIMHSLCEQQLSNDEQNELAELKCKTQSTDNWNTTDTILEQNLNFWN